MANETKNVVISVMKHAEDNLAATTSIDFPGVGLVTDELTEWIQIRLLGPIQAPARSAERRERYVLNCNCFAKSGEDMDGDQTENIWRHLELADAFRSVFHQADVPVKDWATVGDPTIGYLRFEEVGVLPVTDVRKTSLQQAAASVDGVLIL